MRTLHRILGLGIAVAALMAVVALPAPRVDAAPGESAVPLPNPTLERKCGLDILVILDESWSIESSRATDDVRRAFRSFTRALQNTGSRMAVVDFSTVADIPVETYTTVTNQTIDDVFDPYIAGYAPQDNNYTNWEDGFRVGRFFAPRPSPDQSHLVVFITDGDPNTIIDTTRVPFDPGNPNPAQNPYELVVPLARNQTYTSGAAGTDAAATPAIANANAFKLTQSKVLAIAVGSALDNQQSLNRLVRVSGPKIYNGTGDFDITTDDIYRVPQFDELEDALREAAFALCAPSLTVEKLVDETPDPDTDDLMPGEGWSIEADVTAPGGFSWVLPIGVSGDSATVPTDRAGFAGFQWLPNDEVTSTVVVTEETPPAGYVNDTDATECVYRTPDEPDDQPLDLRDVGDGTFTVDVLLESIVTCVLVNRALPDPGIAIKKYTNGFDADNPPPDPDVPYITVGSDIEWTYLVSNTGNVTLDIVVTDDQLGAISCPSSSLAPGRETICSATGTAAPGEYANMGTVVGTNSALGVEVEATDPSHYIGAVPGIGLEKYVIRVSTGEREDADHAPGLFIPSGEDVTWEYEITNTGTVGVDNVELTDSVLGPIDCGLDPGDVIPPGETVTCAGPTEAAADGPNDNVGTVSATDVVGDSQLFDSDPAHYFGEIIALDLEKHVNGDDADTPTGPVVATGNPVFWTFAVTNTGNVPLFGWTIEDTQLDALRCPRIAVIRVGGTVRCFATGVAAEGQQRNDATASATAPSGDSVSDEDPAHYLGVSPEITVVKATNGEPADSPPGPFIPIGDTVTWTYEVTTTGTDPLQDVVVYDSDAEVTPSPVESGGFNVGDTNQNNQLEPGETWQYMATGTAQSDQYTNLSLASGTGVVSGPVHSLDPSHYFGTDGSIALVKYVNGFDANTPAEAALVRVGGEAAWAYVVTNTGNEALSAVALTDDQLGDISCPDTTLAAGASMTCRVTRTAEVGPHANVGTVTATDIAGATVTDTDPAHYRGVEGGIEIVKRTNGEDANEETGPEIVVGSEVEWTYEVSPVDLAVKNVEVTDDHDGVVPEYVSGDSDGDAVLDVGETWLYRATGTAEPGQYANVGTVVGLDEMESDVTDTDPSHYLGVEQLEPGIEIDKSPDDGVVLASGDTHTFTIVVTNTGDTVLTGVAVTDAESPSCDRDIGTLQPGESITYTCTVTVTQSFTNVAVVEGESPDGTTVDDSDDADVSIQLPATGAPAERLTWLGITLLLMGAALVQLVRKRRQRTSPGD